MLTPITQEIPVPENLTITNGKLTHTVATTVKERGVWAIQNPPAVRANAAAKINVFKPNWEERLVEAAEAGPKLTTHRQTRAGRLIDVLHSAVIEVHAAVAAVRGIRGPQAIQ